ncbi:hypothetical protein BDW02DRAFT_602868 [Decorospora gaudefroyi]|uniref:F-box domain-containing protein n=1 Tax=Decorospora gaudefroyi TaxID=184978 RepID=A0A6A5K3A2_9PLEO|nr:hypothetical protein BDW02DRAFT_602868 [Decorospora gaudefroyi]
MPSTKRSHNGELVSTTYYYLPPPLRSSTPAPALPSFSMLPTEIKVHILSLRLVYDRPVTPTLHTYYRHNYLLPLALTCKELHTIATEMYYSKNEFIAQVTKRSEGRRPHFFKYPNPAVGHWLRSLTVKLSFSRISRTDVRQSRVLQHALERAGKWTRKLRADSHSSHAHRYGLPYHGPHCIPDKTGLFDALVCNPASWQTYFENVDLKLVVEFDNQKCFRKNTATIMLLSNCVLWQSSVTEPLARTCLDEVAKKFTVNVRGMRCSNDPQSVCGGACADIMERLLRGQA